MCRISPMFRQILAMACCKFCVNQHFLWRKLICIFEGNLLTMSFGASSGWGTINFNNLQQQNTTFPTGPLTLDEAALVTSFGNIGGFIGTFGILPISRHFGFKRAIYLMGIPLVVSWTKITFRKTIQLIFCENIISVELCFFDFCTKQIPFIHIAYFKWFYWWRTFGWCCTIGCWNFIWQVSEKNVFFPIWFSIIKFDINSIL